MHYYKRNIGDYSKKAGRLSLLQHGVYTQLIDACYDRERFPTREEAIDWVWASTTEEIEAVEFVLRKFFALQDGVYVQNRIAEEIADYHEFCEKQAAKGKTGGKPKKADGQETEPNGLENKPAGLPVESQALPVVTLTTNQEPLTTNQIEESLSGKEPDLEPPVVEKPKNADLKAQASEVLQFLNSKTGRNYQPVNGTLKPLMARLREGFTVTQCRQVIAKKTRDWATDPKMEPYLRPKTLFAQENFANYFGELEVIREQE
jgi:uncharacterized phage protein (TIGR02220 family)